MAPLAMALNQYVNRRFVGGFTFRHSHARSLTAQADATHTIRHTSFGEDSRQTTQQQGTTPLGPDEAVCEQLILDAPRELFVVAARRCPGER